ncbi:PTS system, mannose-specific IIA component / PTS system, mannose-specific IIB component [Escherichia coli ISC7]|uniref:PTS system, mannose-specific IIA component / PTS system, mannose-specific IIB component n=1 Tax=Escherichia coli ISC7 TaxID=1432555 RepID=W1EYK8_ECOLX|nr:PTS system, mannose-specific IIA component / PTS system, mannose-specific IIB component [Escherichia coli ISC7]
MTIAIVIGTHGWAAEQLLKTAEMLLGEQEKRRLDRFRSR